MIELGLKIDALDRRLRTNIAMYYQDYKDIQLTTTRPDPVLGVPLPAIENAGKAEIKGVELEFSFLPTDNLSGILVILAYVYAVFIGLVLGGCVGILRVFWTALRSVEAVLNILLEITGYAAADYERVQSGQAKMPTGGELMQQVYEEVISPAIAKAISGSFGWLGIPILWLYRRTLGFAVSLVIQAVSRRRSHNADDENENGSGEDADTSSSDISPEDERTETNCYSRRIEAFTKRAAGTVSSIGARIRFYAMMPLYIAFSVLLVIGLMPLLLIWWFGTGEPTAA